LCGCHVRVPRAGAREGAGGCHVCDVLVNKQRFRLVAAQVCVHCTGIPIGMHRIQWNVEEPSYPLQFHKHARRACAREIVSCGRGKGKRSQQTHLAELSASSVLTVAVHKRSKLCRSFVSIAEPPVWLALFDDFRSSRHARHRCNLVPSLLPGESVTCSGDDGEATSVSAASAKHETGRSFFVYALTPACVVSIRLDSV
jgi:hypothetical protein